MLDVWNDESAQFMDDASGGFIDNGQRTVHNGLIDPSEDYHHGFTLSGMELFWNFGNKATLKSPKRVLQGDCSNPATLTITVDYYDAGSDTPNETRTLFWYRPIGSGGGESEPH
ncbi:MAG: hypothetical protein HUU21_00645 [Polyangiaceae bacterium]|nr:hypothetical protein [Polyangiaceae bacterium]